MQIKNLKKYFKKCLLFIYMHRNHAFDMFVFSFGGCGAAPFPGEAPWRGVLSCERGNSSVLIVVNLLQRISDEACLNVP